MDDSGDTPSLQKLCPIRWTMRTASFHSVIKNYTILLDTLQEINQGNDVHATRAGGLLSLMKISFVLFPASEQLSRTLQGKDLSAQDAFKATSLTKAYYQRQRNDENFDKFYSYVLLEAKTIKNIKEPKPPKQKKTPKRFDDGAESHVYSTPKDLSRHHYFDILDLIIGEITTGSINLLLLSFKTSRSFLSTLQMGMKLVYPQKLESVVKTM